MVSVVIDDICGIRDDSDVIRLEPVELELSTKNDDVGVTCDNSEAVWLELLLSTGLTAVNDDVTEIYDDADVMSGAEVTS